MITVFVSGRFNVLHPGHVRLLKFARESGDRLIVAVEPDLSSTDSVLVPERLRLEGVRSCSYVDEAFLLEGSAVDAILKHRPAIVVKGKEHQYRQNEERSAVESYGGKLIFSSGEVSFTSRDLVRQEFSAASSRKLTPPLAFMARHGISTLRLEELLLRFQNVRVLVIGDLIVDEYISCDPLGMSQEDPTLVVRPVDSKRFIGGAGIVAAHASGLSGQSTLVSVVGADAEADFARSSLNQLGVRAELFDDPTRPTTLKTRYRCQGKTLLRVSRLNQTSMVPEIGEQIASSVKRQIGEVDLVIFSDFNYGVLAQEVVEELSGLLQSTDATMCADSQSSSQFGDVARFKGMDLLTPTEREARLSVRNTSDGLNVLGESLRSMASARHVILKLGQQGALICPSGEPNQISSPDQIEALNTDPKDVAGAGDSLLTVSGMALAVGATIWEAACLGSIAAAIQVGRLGNTAISMEEMLTSLKR